ncbi:thermonuclease family protein [uncultured Devosia sp.]|uniref:thermonuclease family protein n=1 Tax=uncultured Devosia sp. TaxID=211434 RepID=UPI0035CAFB7E
MQRQNLGQWRPFRSRFGALAAIAILLTCAVLAGWLDEAGSPVSGRPRISDGDSFHLGADRIRLLGIDAPELDQTCTDADSRNWPCGRAARDKLVDLVAAQSLTCQPDGHDRFGRILAICSAGGRDLGLQMVAAGLAVSADDYGREEAAARVARRGLWAGTFDLPRAWRDAHGREAEANAPWSWLPGL